SSGIYITSVVKQRQSEIFQFLDSKKIIYRALDITQSSDVKDEMRRKVGNNTALPPQIFNGDKYCGVSLFTRQSLTSNVSEDACSSLHPPGVI
uniref:Zgc:153284 n=1 Tax=Astyanax mexicanus TaxID=7994 RepID=A0A8B9L1I1_ASTMX